MKTALTGEAFSDLADRVEPNTQQTKSRVHPEAVPRLTLGDGRYEAEKAGSASA